MGFIISPGSYGSAKVLNISRGRLRGTTVSIPNSQSHLLTGFSRGAKFADLSPADQERRFSDLQRINMKAVHTTEDLLIHPGLKQLTPDRISFIPENKIGNISRTDPDLLADIIRLGENHFYEKKIARITLAAGESFRFRQHMATDDPKALAPISDKSDETFLSVQAKDILRAQSIYNTEIPWCIFVHPQLRRNFEEYLVNHKFFGLESYNIFFVEHTGEVPYLTVDGKIARAKDALDWKEQEGSTGEEILFGTSGHGFFAHAFMNNPIIIGGKKYDKTPYNFLKSMGIKTAFLSNIDNLGASIGSKEYVAILGSHIYAAINKSRLFTVELVPPIVAFFEKCECCKLWDQGGVALYLDNHPQILDTNVLSGTVLTTVTDPKKPYPFNTANGTFEINAIHKDIDLPLSLQKRKGLVIPESNFWQLTGQVRSGFVVVSRDLPGLFADPNKFDPDNLSMADYPVINNRFIPTKDWEHREWAFGLYYLTQKVTI